MSPTLAITATPSSHLFSRPTPAQKTIASTSSPPCPIPPLDRHPSESILCGYHSSHDAPILSPSPQVYHPRVRPNCRMSNVIKGAVTSTSPSLKNYCQSSKFFAAPKIPPRTMFHPSRTPQTTHSPANNQSKHAARLRNTKTTVLTISVDYL